MHCFVCHSSPIRDNGIYYIVELTGFFIVFYNGISVRINIRTNTDIVTDISDIPGSEMCCGVHYHNTTLPLCSIKPRWRYNLDTHKHKEHFVNIHVFCTKSLECCQASKRPQCSRRYTLESYIKGKKM